MEYLDRPLVRKPAPPASAPLPSDINPVFRFPYTLAVGFSLSLAVAAVVDYRSNHLVNPMLQKRVFKFVGGVWMPLMLLLVVFPVGEAYLWEKVRKQVWFWQTAYMHLPNNRLARGGKE